MLRGIGPLTTADLHRRSRAAPDVVDAWLADLVQARRVIELAGRDTSRWAVVEDAARVRDALGVPLPQGLPDALLAPGPDPLGDLLARYARTHAVFSSAAAAGWLGIGPAVARDVLRRLVASGRLVTGDLRPPGWSPPSQAPHEESPSTLPEELVSGASERREGLDRASTSSATVGHEGSLALHDATVNDAFCDARVLRILRRRSLASLREAVEPVSATDFARFLPSWQGVGELRGTDGALRAAEQLAGVPIPASALESLILPARVRDYRPGMLDELTTAGELLWQGHGSLAGTDGWVSLHPAELAPLTLAEPEPVTGDLASQVLAAIGGGGYFFRALADQLRIDDAQLSAALWDLVWAGRLGNDTLAPLRVLIQGRPAHRSRPVAPARGRYGRGLPRAAMPRRSGPPETVGRWFALPPAETDATTRAVARAELLLDRYGVVTRGSVGAEEVPGGFAGVYRVLAAAEDAGRVRRGYFVEGLGAAQFGGVGAVDRLRAMAHPLETESTGPALVLAATDPANPYGAALPWPSRPEESGGHLPGRKAGALVVLVDGRLVLYVERGGRTLLSWSDDAALLEPAAAALAGAVHALGKLTVQKVDGESVLGSGQPLALALAVAGFRLTPRGLRLRG